MRKSNLLRGVAFFFAMLPALALAYPSASTDVGITDAACPNWAATKTDTSGRTITISQTISYEEITGQMTIQSSGVTLTCVKINANDNLYGINCATGSKCSGTVVEDSEIYNCGSACLLAEGPNSAGRATFSRLYIYDSQNDLVKLKSYTTLQDSYLEDNYDPAPEAHNDAIQLVDGTDVIIERNNIQGPFQAQTSAIIAKSDAGSITGLIIRNNRLSGGSYSLYIVDGGSGSPTNAIVTGNTWNNNSWQFGAVSADGSISDCLVWYGNVTTTGGTVRPGVPFYCTACL